MLRAALSRARRIRTGSMASAANQLPYFADSRIKSPENVEIRLILWMIVDDEKTETTCESFEHALTISVAGSGSRPPTNCRASGTPHRPTSCSGRIVAVACILQTLAQCVSRTPHICTPCVLCIYFSNCTRLKLFCSNRSTSFRTPRFYHFCGFELFGIAKSIEGATVTSSNGQRSHDGENKLYDFQLVFLCRLKASFNFSDITATKYGHAIPEVNQSLSEE